MFMQFLNGRIQRPFKLESGASGPKSVARGAKLTASAKVCFSGIQSSEIHIGMPPDMLIELHAETLLRTPLEILGEPAPWIANGLES